jgi:hypothetical protein
LVFNLIKSGKERSGACVVAKSFADVGEAVDISRCEDKAALQLKGIGPKFAMRANSWKLNDVRILRSGGIPQGSFE